MVLTVKCVPVVPEFNFICFSCKLKTGTLIIGQLGLLLFLIHSVEAITKLCFYNEEEEPNVRGRQEIVSRLTTGIVEILLHTLLIYGAWKEKPELMLPFLFINYVMLIILVIIIIIFVIMFLYLNAIGWAILTIVLGALITAFVTYLWAGVYAYYRQLEETNLQLTDGLGQQMPRPEETALNSSDSQLIHQDIHTTQPQPYAV